MSSTLLKKEQVDSGIYIPIVQLTIGAAPSSVLSRDAVFVFFLFLFLVFLGGEGIAFVGKENLKNIRETNEFFYCLGGNLKLEGISPLKALKNTLPPSLCHRRVIQRDE